MQVLSTMYVGEEPCVNPNHVNSTFAVFILSCSNGKFFRIRLRWAGKHYFHSHNNGVSYQLNPSKTWNNVWILSRKCAKDRRHSKIRRLWGEIGGDKESSDVFELSKEEAFKLII